MNVCLLVFRPDSLTYTMARALAEGGHEVHVLIADPSWSKSKPNRLAIWLSSTSGVTLVAGEFSTTTLAPERLIIQVYPRLMEQYQAIETPAKLAKYITLITAGDRSRPWQKAIELQWQEMRILGQLLRRVDRIVYKDGYYPLDMFGLWKSRWMAGFDVHSQFLHDPVSFNAIHSFNWRPEDIRPILVNFMGSRDPDVRRQVLDDARPFFSENKTMADGCKSVFWHEYSDASPTGLDPSDFLNVLTHSDFSLCPPGYSLVTHRPMEALLRGSIPVLHATELDLYELGLQDGVNCIAVEHGQWHIALEKIAVMKDAELIGMRQKLKAMKVGLLDYAASSKRMRIRLGIDN